MNSPETIKKYLIDGLRLTSEQSDFLLPRIKHRTYNKDETIFKPGDICNELFYMTGGLVRCFYILEEKDVNLRLMCDGSAVLAYSSFIQQSPSQEYIQCLADCEGYVFSLKDMKSIRDNVPQIERYRRLIAERHYLSMERRLFTLQFKTAEEKYQHFLEYMEEKIVNDTPAHHVAHYLGVTPESLSRIKRQLTKC